MSDPATQTTQTTQTAATQTTQTAGGDYAWLGADTKPEISTYIQGKGFKAPGALAEAYMNLEKAHSSRVFEAPKPEDAEAWKKINAALGVPEAADKYDFGDTAKTMKPEELTFWQGELHKLGIPQKTAAGLVSVVTQRAKAFQDAKDQAFVKDSEEAFGKLKAEWGDNFDANYDLASRGMKALAKELGGLTGEQMKAMEQAIGTRAVHMLGLVAGRHMVEQPFTFGGQPRTGMTKEAAMRELNAMGSDAKYGPALMDRTNPLHREAVEKKRALEQVAFAPAA